MNDDPRFIADASLSGLAKWLRLLGYNTTIYYQTAGRSMMRQAIEGERILLTRRTDMMMRQFSGRILLLPNMEKAKQLSFVINSLSLEILPEKIYSICLVCNESLVPVEQETVRNLVPQYVYDHCRKYNQCPKCRKIYWPGTHGQNAIRYLKGHGIINFDQ